MLVSASQGTNKLRHHPTTGKPYVIAEYWDGRVEIHPFGGDDDPSENEDAPSVGSPSGENAQK